MIKGIVDQGDLLQAPGNKVPGSQFSQLFIAFNSNDPGSWISVSQVKGAYPCTSSQFNDPFRLMGADQVKQEPSVLRLY